MHSIKQLDTEGLGVLVRLEPEYNLKKNEQMATFSKMMMIL